MRILKNGGRARQLNVSLPPELLERLWEEAVRRESSVASVVRQILAAHFKRRTQR